jgi:hypothetical protein
MSHVSQTVIPHVTCRNHMRRVEIQHVHCLNDSRPGTRMVMTGRHSTGVSQRQGKKFRGANPNFYMRRVANFKLLASSEFCPRLLTDPAHELIQQHGLRQARAQQASAHGEQATGTTDIERLEHIVIPHVTCRNAMRCKPTHPLFLLQPT